MHSIWVENVTKPEFESLKGDMQTDVAIIGAGMVGILTASFLQHTGLRVVVLEAGDIGCGQTQNTTAKITCQHDAIYHQLIQKFGLEKATLYATANQEAIKAYADMIEKLDIACEFTEMPAYLYSTLSSELLEKEKEAAQKCGIKNASLTTKTTLPFPVKTALRFPAQAQFHPIKFLYTLAKDLSVYEHTRALSVHNENILIEQGMVSAKHIVFACHYPFINTPGYYFLRMHQERSYIIALENAAKMDGMYYGVDPGGHSFRNSGKYLLLGGEAHRTGKNNPESSYQQLRKTAGTFYRGAVEKANWSAQDGITADGVPYIGRYSPAHPRWYVAAGFGKWGMSTSMVAAKLISDLIQDKTNPYTEVFNPHRLQLSASIGNISKDGWQSMKGTIKRIMPFPTGNVNSLAKGEAKTIFHDGQKYGIYRDKKGEVHIVSAKCPHLGCQLEWNTDDLSWDCPCHGSRFDYRGNILDTPAVEGIHVDKKQL